MAAGTLTFAVENFFAACGGRTIKTTLRRRWSRKRELIEMKGRKLGRDLVIGIGDVTKTVLGSNGKFRSVVQSRIKEVAFAMHLQIGDERVPIRYRTPPGIGVKVYSGKTKGRRNERCGGFAVRTESFSVHKQLSIKLARPPASKNGLDGCNIHAQDIGNRLQIGSKAHDCANVQVAVGPAVQPMSNAGSKCVVHRGVAERALYAH